MSGDEQGAEIISADEHNSVPPRDSIRRWSGREPKRLHIPAVDMTGKQTIEVDFTDGYSISVSSSSTNGAWRVLRARLMMRAVVSD